MKSRTISLSVFLVFILLPFSTFAHEQQTFEIGDELYHFTVGSLNEPIMVDDKTGVDLRVSKVFGHVMADGSMMAGMNHGSSVSTSETPVEGLEDTLKVELKAEGASKIMDLKTVYGVKGAYKAPFYPTRATKITYRVFGEVNGNQVDIAFTCNPVGHDMSAMEENTERIDLGNGIIRVSQKGAFGCPSSREDVTFPDAVPSSLLAEEDTRSASLLGGFGLAVAFAALVVSIRNSKRRITKENT